MTYKNGNAFPMSNYLIDNISIEKGLIINRHGIRNKNTDGVSIVIICQNAIIKNNNSIRETNVIRHKPYKGFLSSRLFGLKY